ncbi:MAG: DNA-binding transcriptional activator PspC [Bacteroidetes bacterium]|nr:DNA-binding transcriptional activator PspC [Bacteroidota bacterium]
MKRLYLSSTDRKIFGVCGGIAEYFDIDPTIVRIGVVAFAIVTAVVPMIIWYIIAKFVIPERPAS